MVGLGTVGSGVLKLLQRSREEFSEKWGIRLDLVCVCDSRRPKEKLRAAGLSGGTLPSVTRDWRELLRHPGVQVVVELMGGRKEALSLVLSALRSGKHVVTANKEMLAHHWTEIGDCSILANRHVFFEASVAGGIPLIQSLEHGLASNRIRRIVGILNGTTNYVLTKMIHERISQSRALAQARQAGFAEKNPRLDMNGTDTAYKLSILASLVSRRWIAPESIYREGIGRLTLEDLKYVNQELGQTVRLLGIFQEVEGQVQARVHPTLIPHRHPFAAVHGEYNAVLVEGDAAGDLIFYGKGAGALPAASAVVSDLLALAQGCLSAPVPPVYAKPFVRIQPIGEIVTSYYLRFQVEDRPGVLSSMSGSLARQGVSIAQVDQRPRFRFPGIPILIVTHSCRERQVRRALQDISTKRFLLQNPVWIRTLQ